MRNITFYRYMPLKNLDTLKEQLFAIAKTHGVTGKILIAEEGINTSLEGDHCQNVVCEMEQLLKTKFDVKTTDSKYPSFKRMLVKIRKEIVTSDLGNVTPGEYIEPKELCEILDKKKKIILLDARNDYEHEMGTFEGAIHLDIQKFRDFKANVYKLDKYKKTPIVTFCTGGIRCEKASGYLRDQGFSVKQLHGGILGYREQCGNKHWRGKCFVFDKREVVEME